MMLWLCSDYWDRTANWETPTLPSKAPGNRQPGAFFSFRFHIFRKRRGEPSLAPAKQQQQQHTKQLLCQDLAVKSLKIWCSQSINNLCLPAWPSCTSRFPSTATQTLPYPSSPQPFAEAAVPTRKPVAMAFFPPTDRCPLKTKSASGLLHRAAFSCYYQPARNFHSSPSPQMFQRTSGLIPED